VALVEQPSGRGLTVVFAGQCEVAAQRVVRGPCVYCVLDLGGWQLDLFGDLQQGLALRNIGAFLEEGFAYRPGGG
jgi:hypothetical protein